MDSITAFAGSVSSRRAYKEFCKNLSQIGVTAEMINQKESEIFEIFKAQNTAISGRIRNSPIEDQVRAFFRLEILSAHYYTNRKSGPEYSH